MPFQKMKAKQRVQILTITTKRILLVTVMCLLGMNHYIKLSNVQIP